MVYSFGLSYTDESGVTGVDNYKRYNFSASVDRNIGKKVKIGLNMYSAYSQTISSAETVRQAYRLNGLSDMYNEDGSLRVFRMMHWVMCLIRWLSGKTTNLNC